MNIFDTGVIFTPIAFYVEKVWGPSGLGAINFEIPQNSSEY